jgi:hypothetical protein
MNPARAAARELQSRYSHSQLRCVPLADLETIIARHYAPVLEAAEAVMADLETQLDLRRRIMGGLGHFTSVGKHLAAYRELTQPVAMTEAEQIAEATDGRR